MVNITNTKACTYINPPVYKPDTSKLVSGYWYFMIIVNIVIIKQNVTVKYQITIEIFRR